MSESKLERFEQPGELPDAWFGVDVESVNPPCNSFELLRRKVAEDARLADNLQRREYAKSALVGILANKVYTTGGNAGAATYAFDLADALLAEQKKREGR